MPCDQFGGEAGPELVVQLVEQGRITEERLDVSVGRLLREKFILGLFDNPYVDIDHAAATVGKAEVRCRRCRCPAPGVHTANQP
jgi:beta-glucosidase